MTDNKRDSYSVDDALLDLGQQPAGVSDEPAAEPVGGRTSTDTAPRSAVPGGIAGAGASGDPAGAGGGGTRGSRRASRGGAGDGSGSGHAGNGGGAGVVIRRIRDVLASVVLTVAVLAAAVLALGAVLTVLGANPENAITSTVRALGGQLDGPFADLFTFDGEPGKQVLVNWAIAALAYLIAGRVLERALRP